MKRLMFSLMLALAASTITVNAQSSFTQDQSTSEKQSSGVILEYNGSTGMLQDSETNEILAFEHEGASVDFAPGKLVTYLRVTTPRGRVIVKEIRKPL